MIPLILPRPFGVTMSLLDTLFDLPALNAEERLRGECNALIRRSWTALDMLTYVPGTEAVVRTGKADVGKALELPGLEARAKALKAALKKIETELERARKELSSQAKVQHATPKQAKKHKKALEKLRLIEERLGQDLAALRSEFGDQISIAKGVADALGKGDAELQFGTMNLSLERTTEAEKYFKSSEENLKTARKAAATFEKDTLGKDKSGAIKKKIAELRKLATERAALLGDANVAHLHGVVLATLSHLDTGRASVSDELEVLQNTLDNATKLADEASVKLVSGKQDLTLAGATLSELRKIAPASELIEAYSQLDKASKALDARTFDISDKALEKLKATLLERSRSLEGARKGWLEAKAKFASWEKSLTGMEVPKDTHGPTYTPSVAAMRETLTLLRDTAGSSLTFADAVAQAKQLELDVNAAIAHQKAWGGKGMDRARADARIRFEEANDDATTALGELGKALADRGVTDAQALAPLQTRQDAAVESFESLLGRAAALPFDAQPMIDLVTAIAAEARTMALPENVAGVARAANLALFEGRLQRSDADMSANLRRAGEYPVPTLDALRKQAATVIGAAIEQLDRVRAKDDAPTDRLVVALDAIDTQVAATRRAWEEDELRQRDARNLLATLNKQLGADFDEIEKRAGKICASFSKRDARGAALKAMPRLRYQRDASWAMAQSRMWTTFDKGRSALERLAIEAAIWMKAVKGKGSAPDQDLQIGPRLKSLAKLVGKSSKTMKRFRPSRLQDLNDQIEALTTELASPTQSYSYHVESFNQANRLFQETKGLLVSDAENLGRFKEHHTTVAKLLADRSEAYALYVDLWARLNAKLDTAKALSRAEARIGDADELVSEVQAFITDLDKNPVDRAKKLELGNNQEAIERSRAAEMVGTWEARSANFEKRLDKLKSKEAQEQLGALYASAKKVAKAGNHEEALRQLDVAIDRLNVLAHVGKEPSATALDELPELEKRWRRDVGVLRASIQGFAGPLRADFPDEVAKAGIAVLEELSDSFNVEAFAPTIPVIAAKSTEPVLRRKLREAALDEVRHHRELLRQRKLVLLDHCTLTGAKPLDGHVVLSDTLYQLERLLLMAVPIH